LNNLINILKNLFEISEISKEGDILFVKFFLCSEAIRFYKALLNLKYNGLYEAKTVILIKALIFKI